MKRMLLLVAVALALTPIRAAADDGSAQELAARIAGEALLGAQGSVDIAVGRIGKLPVPVQAPDGARVIGTVAQLPTGPNAFGGTSIPQYSLYLQTVQTPNAVFEAIGKQLIAAGYRIVPPARGIAPEGFVIFARAGATFCRRDNDPSVFVRAWTNGNDRSRTDVLVDESPAVAGVPNTCRNLTGAPGSRPPALPEIVSTDSVAIVRRTVPPSTEGVDQQFAAIETQLPIAGVLTAWGAQIVAAGWSPGDSQTASGAGIASFRRSVGGRPAVTYVTISRLGAGTLFAEVRAMWEQ